MEKFRFFKKNLQTKGPSIAKTAELKPLLETPDTNSKLTWAMFKGGLEAATKSTHATDKILAMMKSYSMISTKKLAKEDDKKTTHIKFPLNSRDKTKIETIPSSYGWKSADTTTITNFITSYDKIGKLAKAKISWVITKVHNPKELAQLAFKTEGRTDERKEVRALLEFIKAHPITEESDIIKISDKSPYVYHLDTYAFEGCLENYITIPDDLKTALNTYRKTFPNSDALQHGVELPDHGNNEIKAYNTALKELMNEGTINNTPPEDPFRKKAEARTKQFKAEQTESKEEEKKDKRKTEQEKEQEKKQEKKVQPLTLVSTEMDKLLQQQDDDTLDDAINAAAHELFSKGQFTFNESKYSAFGAGELSVKIEIIRQCLAAILPELRNENPDYKACIDKLKNHENLLPITLIECLEQYIENQDRNHTKSSSK